MDSGQATEQAAARERRRGRRTHHRPPRTHGVRFLLSVEEYAELSAAAAREGLADGAYAAQAALAAARGSARPEYAALRELIAALMQASGQVRRVGVNFNQSVAALNATGELAEQLAQYARVADRAVLKLDGVADEVRTRLP